MENAATGGGSGMNVTSFQGKQVGLKAFDAERDAEIIARWNQDSEYQQLQSSGPALLWSAKQFKDWAEKHYAEMYSFSIFTLPEETASGADLAAAENKPAVAESRLIGSVDLGGLDWICGNAWVGIGIGEREYWGKGFGTEAMNLILDFAFGYLNLKRVSLTVFEYNQRGLKSYRKVGFKEEGRMRQWMQRGGERFDLIFMGILREEWVERRKNAPAAPGENRDMAQEDQHAQQAA
jgi:RimJ/RimL family protein N-acetyltransferase